MEYDINNEPNEELKNINFKKNSDDNNLYYDITKIKTIEYYFTQKSLDSAKKYSKDNEITNLHEEMYMRYIIDIYDNKKHVVIGSRNTLWSTIRTMLILYYNSAKNKKDGKKSVSIAFDFDNIINIRCKLLAIVKLTKQRKINDQLRVIKQKYENISIVKLIKIPVKKIQSKKEGKLEQEKIKLSDISDTSDTSDSLTNDELSDSDELVSIKKSKPPTKISSVKDLSVDKKQISQNEKQKYINKTIELYIKTNLKRRKDEYITITKVLKHFKESSEFKASKLLNTDINRNTFYVWLKKYKWFNDNYKDKYKNIRSVLMNYNIVA